MKTAMDETAMDETAMDENGDEARRCKITWSRGELEK